jgi:hypothetical protein
VSGFLCWGLELSIFSERLKAASSIKIVQKRELAEFFGFETRNKYEIRTADDLPIGFAAEQNKGLLGFLARQLLGHWRSFEIHIFDSNRQLQFTARHPFRIFFQRLEVFLEPGDRLAGALQQRFSILYKKFDVEDNQGQVIMTVASPLWRIWTFEFKWMARLRATVRKKWSGFFREALLDADRFEVEFNDPSLKAEERSVMVAAAIFIDLQYFERKAN